jgi:hypothetical protein
MLHKTSQSIAQSGNAGYALSASQLYYNSRAYCVYMQTRSNTCITTIAYSLSILGMTLLYCHSVWYKALSFVAGSDHEPHRHLAINNLIRISNKPQISIIRFLPEFQTRCNHKTLITKVGVTCLSAARVQMTVTNLSTVHIIWIWV